MMPTSPQVMIASKTDVQHLYINATVYKDRVEETHYITDPARNIRRRPQTKVWQTERILGYGSFGDVRLEKNIEDGKERAVKKIRTRNKALSNNECEKELKALLEFSKPKHRETGLFVDFFGWFQNDSDIFLAMEYVPLGDLERNLGQAKKIPETEARCITEQLLLGLEIMHAECFAHRDLKPQNVLVVHGPPDWWVKLADFGLSKRLTASTGYHSVMIGTETYMAPELHEGLTCDGESAEYTNAVDLWAVGCITYRLVTGTVPFPPGRSLARYCDDSSLFPDRLLSKSGIADAGSRFIHELLVTDPRRRLSASQAFNHSWITKGHRSQSCSKDHSPPQENTSGVSEPALSTIDYNTASHRALKSLLHPIVHRGVKEPSPLQASPNALERLQPGQNIVNSWLNEVKTAFGNRDQREKWKPHSKSFKDLAFSPNGRLVAFACSDSMIRTFDPATGKMPYAFTGKKVTNMKFSPNGQLLAFISFAVVREYHNFVHPRPTNKALIWNTVSKSTIFTFTDYNSGIDGFTFSPNCHLMALKCNNGKILIRDFSEGKTLCVLDYHGLYITRMKFASDSQLVTFVRGDTTIRLWDSATGTLSHSFEGHERSVTAVAFSSDSHLMAAATHGNMIWLWDLVTKTRLNVFKADFITKTKLNMFKTDLVTKTKLNMFKADHGPPIVALQFSPTGQFLAIADSPSNNILIWDLVNNRMRYKIPAYISHNNEPMAFLSSGQLVTFDGKDFTVQIWDFTTETMRRCYIHGDGGLNADEEDIDIPFSSLNIT